MFDRDGVVCLEYRDGEGKRYDRADEREPGKAECFHFLQDHSFLGHRDGYPDDRVDYRVVGVRDRAERKLREYIHCFFPVFSCHGRLRDIDFHGLPESTAGDVALFLLFVDNLFVVRDVDADRQYAGMGSGDR